MPHKESYKDFLESYPLYRKFKTDVPKTTGHLMPGIKFHCKKCKSYQTFVEWDCSINSGDDLKCSVIELEYVCGGCDDSYQYIFIEIGCNLDYVMKIGQYPPWNPPIDKNLIKMLGEREETFKKGLTCESQGYGIGAYDYYRRIVEEIIDELLNGIADLMSGEDKEKYMEALEKKKKSYVAQNKIALVKDLLPLSLMPDGNNPLKLLHSQLSSGIHAFSDEECLKKSEKIRVILLFLVKEVNNHRNSSKEFTESMKELLSKSK